MLFTIWLHLRYFLTDFWAYLTLLFISPILIIAASYKIYKSNFSQKKKKALFAFFFFVLSFIVVFSIFEAYFRYVYDDSDGLGFLKVNERWHKRHVVFNNFFFRDRDFVEDKKEGTIRIGVLGDSITQGDGIKDVSNRFSNLLEKKLLDAGMNVEVYNLGKAGYDTQGEIDVYTSIKHLNFDLIIWEYFINDIQPKEKSTGTPIIVQNSHRAKIFEFISNQSFFLDFLYWRFSTVYDKTILALRSADVNQYKNEFVLERHKQDISRFIKSLKAENKKIVVIMFPSIMLLGQDYPVFTNEIMLNHFKENDVEVINLYDYLKDQSPLKLRASRFDTHPNEVVQALAADKLFEKIKPILEKNR